MAEKTWKTSLKMLARTGAEPELSDWGEVGEPTLTKFIFRLGGSEFGGFLVCFRGRGGGGGGGYVPEGTFGSDAQVLQDEPDAHIVVWVGEFEGADAEAADEVSGEHAAGGGPRVLGRSGQAF